MPFKQLSWLTSSGIASSDGTMKPDIIKGITNKLEHFDVESTSQWITILLNFQRWIS